MPQLNLVNYAVTLDDATYVIGVQAAKVVRIPAVLFDGATFVGKNDTPASYSGSANYLVQVNSDATGLEFTNTPTLGTPTSGNLTNCSGLPISGITSLGTGVASALGSAVNGASGLAVATASGNWLFGAASESVTYKVRIGGGLRIDPNTVGNTGLYQVFDASLASSTTLTSYTATGYITYGTSSSGRGISYSIYNEIPTGITASSSIGLQIISLRNAHNADTDDGGTLSNIYGAAFTYGHFNNNASVVPITTSSSGIKITPIAQTGIITTNTMLYLASQIGSATVSNKWAIYQEDVNYRNYFNGTVLVGTASTDGVNKLQVAGSTITQGLMSGGNELSSGTVGVNALLSGSCDYYWYTGGSLRWIMRRTTDAESGSDVGSNLDIMSRTDTGTSKSTVMRLVRATGNVLIGTTSDYAYSSKLYVYNDKYDINSAGIQTYIISRCTTSGSIVTFGSCMVVDPRVASGIANSGSAYSILAQSYTLGTGFAGSLANLYGVSSQTGIYACDSGATITNVYGLHSVIYNGSANGTITNAYGCYIVNDQTVGTITNRWGVFQTGAAANNYFQASVNIGTTSVNASYKLQVSGTTKSTRTLDTVVTMTAGSAVTLDANAGSYFTLTPAQNCTINATNPIAGQTIRIAITTSGTSSYTITFGTNFKSQGTLATGADSAKTFVLTFACFDGTTYCEISRTVAM